MEAYVDTLRLLAQPKGQQFKNKKQPELKEKPTVWKTDNQGDKEETFIQTSRRGGDGQPGWRGLTARWRLADPARCGLWSGAGQAAASRPRGPTFTHR